MHIDIDPSEVERRLNQLIAKHKAKNMSVAEIKKRIYEIDGEDVMRESNLFQKWWMNCFRRADKDAFGELLQAFQDAWNSFPHRSLEGKSPQQVMKEEMKKHPDMRKDNIGDSMPNVTVGDVTMSWDDYAEMIKRMEKQQEPFKKWVEETALPAYKKYLETRYKSQKTINKHYDVAHHFFRRALHVGFLDFEDIRPDFAVWEFPDWWPTHILYSNLNEDQVWSSLCDFLWFAEYVLRRSIPGVWDEAEGECDDHGGQTCPHCGSAHTEPITVGRNDPCPCGAKKSDGTPMKYKHCHGR